MASFPRDTHRHTFSLVKGTRKIPFDRAEKLDQIKQKRFNVQFKELRKRINKRIT